MADNDKLSSSSNDKEMRRDSAQGGQAMPISHGGTISHAQDAPHQESMSRTIPTSDGRTLHSEEHSGAAYANPYATQKDLHGAEARALQNGRSMSGRMGYWAAVGLLAAIPAGIYMRARRRNAMGEAPVSQGSAVERIARVLAAQRLSGNAQGTDHSVAQAIDKQWRAYIPDARAVLRTLREPDAQMAKVGNARVWETMVRSALDQPARPFIF